MKSLSQNQICFNLNNTVSTISKRFIALVPASAATVGLYFLDNNWEEPIFLGIIMLILIELLLYIHKVNLEIINVRNQFDIFHSNQLGSAKEKISPILIIIERFSQSINFIQRSDYLARREKPISEAQLLNNIAITRLEQLKESFSNILESEDYESVFTQQKLLKFVHSDDFHKI